MTKREKWLNKTHLSRLLKVSRGTLDKYLAMPGAPKPNKRSEYKPSLVSVFVQGNAPRAGGESDDLRDLKKRVLLANAQKAEIEVKQATEELIPVAKIRPVVEAYLSELTTNLQAKFEMELPPKYRGKNQIECAQMNAEAVDFVLKRMKAGAWLLGIPKG